MNIIDEKLNLPGVTLICLTNKDFEAHKRAVDKSCEQINFGAVKIIWDEKCISIDEWNRKIVYELWKYVDTSHALLIHADGAVQDPSMWDDEWLELDYIGSPWPLPQDDYSYRDYKGQIHRVGNSVSLRSRKLMELPSKIGMPWRDYYGFTNEDGFICVHNRHIFERFGCKFGTFEQALKFGKEAPLPENEGLSTFVYHQY